MIRKERSPPPSSENKNKNDEEHNPETTMTKFSFYLTHIMTHTSSKLSLKKPKAIQVYKKLLNNGKLNQRPRCNCLLASETSFKIRSSLLAGTLEVYPKEFSCPSKAFTAV